MLFNDSCFGDISLIKQILQRRQLDLGGNPTRNSGRFVTARRSSIVPQCKNHARVAHEVRKLPSIQLPELSYVAINQLEARTAAVFDSAARSCVPSF